MTYVMLPKNCSNREHCPVGRPEISGYPHPTFPSAVSNKTHEVALAPATKKNHRKLGSKPTASITTVGDLHQGLIHGQK